MPADPSQWFVNGVAGNDGNDGHTVDTPRYTIPASFAASTELHVRGVAGIPNKQMDLSALNSFHIEGHGATLLFTGIGGGKPGIKCAYFTSMRDLYMLRGSDLDSLIDVGNARTLLIDRCHLSNWGAPVIVADHDAFVKLDNCLIGGGIIAGENAIVVLTNCYRYGPMESGDVGTIISDPASAAIQANTDLIVAGKVNVVSAITNGGRELSLFRAADHKATTNHPVSVKDPGDWPTLVAGTIVALVIRKRTDDSVVLTVPGAVVVGANPQEVRVEVSRASSAVLALGSTRYTYRIEATLPGGASDVWPLSHGIVKVA